MAASDSDEAGVCLGCCSSSESGLNLLCHGWRSLQNLIASVLVGCGRVAVQHQVPLEIVLVSQIGSWGEKELETSIK